MKSPKILSNEYETMTDFIFGPQSGNLSISLDNTSSKTENKSPSKSYAFVCIKYAHEGLADGKF